MNHRNFNSFGGSSCRINVDWAESFAARIIVRDGEWTDALYYCGIRMLMFNAIVRVSRIRQKGLS